MFRKKVRRKVGYQQALTQASLPPKSRRRVQATWINHQGDECKKIIEPNRCFCSHLYEQHHAESFQPYCGVMGCKCRCYEYVPYYDIKCMCRHSYKDHDRNSRKCKMCKKCLGFVTNWSCKCGFRFGQHETVMNFSEKAETGIQGKGSTVALREPLKDKKNVTDQRKTRSNFLHYEEKKFAESLAIYLGNEHKISEQRQKQIERVNRKYSRVGMEGHAENSVSSKGEDPKGRKSPNPLELYLKPHNYRYVKVGVITQPEYNRYAKVISNVPAQ